MNRDSVKILGCYADGFTFEEAVEYAYSNNCRIVTINPEMIMNANKDAEFAKVINSADLSVPDGIGVEIGLKILGHKVTRIPGINLGKALIVKFSKEKKSIAMVGAKPGTAEKAAENLKKEIPDLNIIYLRDGYFEDEEAVLNEIEKSAPDLVLAALGSPKQEFFLNSLKNRLPKATMIGLGGSFDVWSGEIRRAPEVYQKTGLEWLYRTIKEPKRFKRIFPTLPVFVLKVIKERLIGK